MESSLLVLATVPFCTTFFFLPPCSSSISSLGCCNVLFCRTLKYRNNTVICRHFFLPSSKLSFCTLRVPVPDSRPRPLLETLVQALIPLPTSSAAPAPAAAGSDIFEGPSRPRAGVESSAGAEGVSAVGRGHRGHCGHRFTGTLLCRKVSIEC